jgi:hypothetical protein
MNSDGTLQMFTIVVLLGGGFLVFRWLSRRECARMLDLIRQRAGNDRHTFVNYFKDQSVPNHMLDVVYEYFQRWMGTKDFPVLPQDKVAELYGIVDEELEDTMCELLEKWDRDWPPEHELQGMAPVMTVQDVVLFLAQSPPLRKKRKKV